MRGKYIGSIPLLIGQTAILQNIDLLANTIEAQFDHVKGFTHGWHCFPLSDFQIFMSLYDTYYSSRSERGSEKDSAKSKEPKQPKEYAPDTIAPELLAKRLRDW